MTAALLFGGLTGLGVFLTVSALVPPRVNLAVSVGRFDAARRAEALPTPPADQLAWRWRLGTWAKRQALIRGWNLLPKSVDLAILDRSAELHLATKITTAATGFVLIPLGAAVAAALGLAVSWTVPTAAAVALAALGFILPDFQVRKDARARRREFTRVLADYYAQVAINLAGGRSIAQALPAVARRCDHWVFHALGDAIARAQHASASPWQTLGDLGARYAITDLQEFAGALNLVAEDGATVKDSLVKRTQAAAAKEITDDESLAAERQSTMTLANFVPALGLVAFVLAAALWNVLQL